MSDFKFGVCISFKDPQKLLEAKNAGAEFYEINFADIYRTEQNILDEFYDFTKSEGIPCYAANGMFPAEIKLVGPEIDYNIIDEYLDKTAERFSKLGGKTVVLGSGRARSVPEGYSFESASEDFIKVCSEHIAPYMKKYGLVCAIEPLRSGECNLITTAKRGFEICKAVNLPEIRLLVDLYHFDSEKEDRESILEYKEYLHHIHLASYTNERKYPKPDDGTDYRQFIELLRKMDYKTKAISLEGRCDDFYEEAKTAFDLIKSL